MQKAENEDYQGKKQHKRKDTTMKTMQKSSIRGRRNALPSKKDEERTSGSFDSAAENMAAKLFMCGIVAVIVAIDVLAIFCAK